MPYSSLFQYFLSISTVVPTLVVLNFNANNIDWWTHVFIKGAVPLVISIKWGIHYTLLSAMFNL